jgi:hypothetical protein
MNTYTLSTPNGVEHVDANDATSATAATGFRTCEVAILALERTVTADLNADR